MGSKGSNTTTNATTTAPNQTAMNAYNSVLQQAQGVAATPYQAYTGEGVAPFNTEQNQGVSGINQYANAAQPNLAQASSMVSGAANPLTQQQIQSYMSPYTQDVVNTTQAQFNNQNQQQQQGVVGNAIAQGALGGNRSAIAQSEMANQQQLAQAPVIAGLENQGYQTGLQTATQQYQTNPQAAAGLLGNLGVAGQTAGLQGAGSQLGAGTQQQTTQQALDTYLQQQYNTAQAYPFQTTQWLAGLDTGVGSQMGGTSVGETTAPAPSAAGQIAGGVTSAAGLLGATGAYGSAGWLAPLLLSDVRAKENIKSVGKLNDGQIIFRFNYKGDPTTHIGLLAQNVEKGKHPEAVHTVNGLKHVDYKAATEDAIKRAMGGVVGYASGGTPSNGVAPMPWANAPTWIPQNTIAHGAGAPHISAPSAYQAPQQSNQASQIGALAKDIKGSMDGPAFGGGSLLGGDIYGGSSSNPASNPSSGVVLSPSDYGTGFAEGGVVNGASISDMVSRGRTALDQDRDNSSRFAARVNAGQEPASMNRHDVIDFLRKPVQGYADGGSPGDTITDDDRLAGYDLLRQGLGVKAPDSIPGGEPAPGGTIHKDDNDNVINPDEPYRMPDQKAVKEWRAGVDKPNPAVIADVPEKTNGIAPTRAMAFSGDPDTKADVPSEVALGYSAHGKPESQPPAQGVAPSSGFDWSSNNKLWPSLISAGFGMLASRSPNFGNVIGEGGQAGMGAYNAQTKAEQDARQHAEQLELERERLERPYSEMTAAEKAADKRSQETSGLREIDQAIKLRTPIQIMPAQPGMYGTPDKPPIMAMPKLNKDGELELYPILPDGTLATKPIKPGESFIQSQGQTLPAPATAGGAGGIGTTPPIAPTSSTTSVTPPMKPTLVSDRPMTADGNPPDPAAPPASVGGRDENFLKKVAETNPSYAMAVKKAADYELDPSSYASMRGLGKSGDSARSKFINDVIAYDHTYSPAMMPSYMGARKQFYSGARADQIAAYNTAISHLDTLRELYKELNNGPSQTLNRIVNTFKQEFGYDAPTNVNAAKQIIGSEIIKAVVGSHNALGDRDEIAGNIKRDLAAGQPEGVIQTYERLMLGQLESKRHQYEETTHLHNFESFLSPHTQDVFKKVAQKDGIEPVPDFGAKKIFKQGTGVWDGHKYIPESEFNSKHKI